MTSEEYRTEYLQSDHWRKVREAALNRAGHRCQVCNGTHILDVHHRTYERLGREEPGDLTVLCRRCHGLFHAGATLQQEKRHKWMMSAASEHHLEQSVPDPRTAWVLVWEYLKKHPWSTAAQVRDNAAVAAPAGAYDDWAYRVLAAACEDGLVKRRNIPTTSNRYGYNVEWAVVTKAERKKRPKRACAYCKGKNGRHEHTCKRDKGDAHWNAGVATAREAGAL